MEHQLCVLLYSKYSPNSKKIMETIRLSPVDIMATAKISLLCVDNEDVRSKVIKSSKLNVKSVPCILIVFPDGGVEKYEGTTAFEWVDEIINKYSPPVLAEPIRQEPVYHEPIRQEPVYQEPVQTMETKRPAKKSRTRQAPPPEPIDEFTSISDLDEDNDSDSESDYKQPPKPLRNGSGNYDYDSGFGKPMSPPKPTVSTAKNIMATALAMQKSREIVNPKKPKHLL